ncbi:MAG TPA: PAS domain-containing protein [Rhizomicrobium sp.]|nr:PAS domain-containing protein [Rhizomicrobium sp.]
MASFETTTLAWAPLRKRVAGGAPWSRVWRPQGCDSVTTSEFERAFAQFESSIASPDLKEVAQYWRQICSPPRLPSWNDIRPNAIKAQLRIIWCYDYDPALDDFIGRLAGVAITSLSKKPFKGARLSELRPADKYPRSMIRAKRVLQEPALYRGYGLVYKTDDIGGIGERIVMPLRSAGNLPAAIFGAATFRSVIDWAHAPSVDNKEDEQWFSLAGLVEMPIPADA